MSLSLCRPRMPLPGTQHHGTGSAKDSFLQFHRTCALRALVLGKTQFRDIEFLEKIQFRDVEFL